jgi:hypothetical protein
LPSSLSLNVTEDIEMVKLGRRYGRRRSDKGKKKKKKKKEREEKTKRRSNERVVD